VPLMALLVKLHRKLISYRIVPMALGAIGTILITLPASLVHEDRQFPYAYGAGYDRKTLTGYEVFSPRLKNQQKHIIVGSCEVSLPFVANDLNSPSKTARADGTAWFGNVLNFLSRNDFSTQAQIGFYDISAPGYGMAGHLPFIHQALNASNLRSLIYVNGISVGHYEGLKEQDILEIVSVLENWKSQYPRARPYIEVYLKGLYRSEEYKKAAAKFGTEWRKLVDPVSMTLKVSGKGNRVSAYALLFPSTSSADRHVALADLKRRLSNLFIGPAKFFLWVLDSTGNFRILKRNKELRQSLDWAGEFYGRADNEAPVTFINEQKYLKNQDQYKSELWFKILGEVTSSKGVQLVLYQQPMISIPPKEYQNNFKPNYVDTAKRWLEEYDPIIIDHTVNHNLTQQDFIFTCNSGDCLDQNRSSTGFYANIFGRVKQGRLLLDSLIENNVLASTIFTSQRSWANERFLPKTERCIRRKGLPGACVPWNVP